MNSMQRYIDSNSTVSRVFLLKSIHHGAFLIVEGDPDIEVYGNLVDSSQCRLITAFGRSEVEKAIKILVKRGFNRAIAIVDADFSVLEGVTEETNIFFTDTHDLESMLIQSPALEKVIASNLHGDYKNSRQKIGSIIREKALLAMQKVGYLRWFSQSNNLPLSFKKINFKNCIDMSNYEVNIKAVVQNAKKSSIVCPISDEDLCQHSQAMKQVHHDVWHIVHGKDMINFIILVFRQVVENELGAQALNRRKSIDYGRFVEDLCTAYEKHYFYQTNLYKKIKRWEEANSHLIIFN